MAASAMLPMTTSDISSHLLSDWVPSLPATVGSSFIGWPPFLIEVASFNGNDILALREETRRVERQWKSVLSWMLGVAGTRHVLASEGYRWIAPLSAFYPGVLQPLDLAAWHPLFPCSTITVDRRPGTRCRLRPDYLALRSTAAFGQYEWAVVEAKGTQACLTNTHTCPRAWASQVRSVAVAVNGLRRVVPRRLVVATRVNPNAARPSTRRIQVRAWNHKDESEESRLPSEATVDIAAAHLFGLFRGLRLRDNALAMAVAVQARTEARGRSISDSTRAVVTRVSERAEAELLERTRLIPQPNDREAAFISVDTDLGTIDVEVAAPVISLARLLQRTEAPDRAVAALREADAQLDAWEASRRSASRQRGSVVLPFGVELRLPDGFELRS